MRRLILVFVAGVVAMALSVEAVKADPPEAVLTPMPNATGTVAPAPNPQFYNGYWWYRMPDGRWLYYANGQWVSPPAQAVYAYPNYAPQPYYYPYSYGYGYPNIGGAVFIGGGWGGGGHGGWHH